MELLEYLNWYAIGMLENSTYWSGAHPLDVAETTGLDGLMDGDRRKL